VFTYRRKQFENIVTFVCVISVFLFPSLAVADEILTIGGVGSSLGSMKLISNAFEKFHPDVKVRVLPSLGSSGGIKAVFHDAIDIGLSGRPLTDEERKGGAVETEYAESPFVFVTNKRNAASGLSIREIADIFEGKEQTWTDGSRIRLVLRPAFDTDTIFLENISPEMGRAVRIALARPGMIVAITNQESDAIVEKTPGSLGTSTLTQIITENRSLKILAIDGVMPSVRNHNTGTYPFVKRFYIITKIKPTAFTQKFIDFVRTNAGRKILEDAGNVAITKNAGK
jgi:phosphate transport system substrate-binding protein